MKKTLTVLMMVLMAAVLFVSCDNNAKEPKYNVAFDLDGGKGYIPEQNVVKGGKIAAVKNPTKEGYAFCGWVNSSDNKTFDLTTDTVSSNIILKAVWKLAYTVTFETGEGASEVEEQIVIVGEKATKPENPTKTGYTFKEWLNNGSAYNFDNLVTENITLKADWTINSYTVTLDNDGGTPASYSLKAEYNSVISDVPADPTKTGFKFNGWYDGETKVDLKTLKITKDINLKAKWTAKASYKVTFDIDGGTGAIADQTVYEGEKIQAITNPTKADYYFGGWATSDGKTFNIGTDVVNSNLALKAVWKKTYAVGDSGPAGGIIFYDVDADNGNTSNDGLDSKTLGWRYLEAATSNLDTAYTWGPKVRINGTSYQIGAGKANTEILKAAGIDSYPAAKACVDYRGGGYSDWFLPSVSEAIAMMGVSGLNVTISSEFWTSTDCMTDEANIAPHEGSGNFTSADKNGNRSVRPVRCF